eukprot:2618419-Pyramimonas_sp.AAC.1
MAHELQERRYEDKRSKHNDASTDRQHAIETLLLDQHIKTNSQAFAMTRADYDKMTIQREPENGQADTKAETEADKFMLADA